MLSADGEVVSDVDGVRLLPLRPGVVAGRDAHRVLPHDRGLYEADVYTSLPDGTDRRQVTATDDNEIRVEWGSS